MAAPPQPTASSATVATIRRPGWRMASLCPLFCDMLAALMTHSLRLALLLSVGVVTLALAQRPDVYVLMISILLWRPQGLFSRQGAR